MVVNRKLRRRRKKLAGKRGGRSADAGDLFDSAVESFGSGRMGEAEKHLKQLLKIKPEDADALHLFGLTVYQLGRLEEAGEAIWRALALDGDNPLFHSNHGVVLNLLGRAEDGEKACRRSLELRPGNAEAHNNLGVALKLQGRLDEAGEACRRAIEISPEYAEAHINLGNIHRQGGADVDAVQSYRRAVELAPDNVLAHSNLGAALRQVGEVEEAGKHCRRAVHLNPGYAEGHNNLGNVLRAEGDLGEAEAAFRRAIHIRPGFVEARVNLGAILFAQGRLADSEDAYRQVLEADEDHAEAHNGLGVALLAASRLEEAVESFRRAAEFGHADALYNLASSGRASLSEAEMAAVAVRAADEGLAAAERIALHFALGEIYDKRAQWDAAFAHFGAGNRLRKGELARHGHVFDAQAHDQRVEGIIAAHTAELFTAMKGGGVASELPVFVVGMPRSGTTLVEQIAASHPLVHGAGELGEIAALAGEGGDAAHQHVQRLQALSPGAARVIDKTPFNFLHLGAIARMFPKARVIHCRRQARDLCLSCYFQNFVAPHPWSTDLQDLRRYLGAYDRLMEHWRKVLPLSVLDVDYEDLVNHIDGQSRRLIDFLGLPWDDGCLAFHDNRRAVTTASNWQVRRPVYATSVDRWRNYLKHLVGS